MDYGTVEENGGKLAAHAQSNAVSVSFRSHSMTTPTSTLLTGVTYQVAIVVPVGATTTGDVLIYINGINQTLSLISGSAQTLDTGDINVTIAARDDGDFHLRGLVDEFSIHDRALSSNELLWYYELSQLGYPGLLNRIDRRAFVGAAAAGFVHSQAVLIG